MRDESAPGIPVNPTAGPRPWDWRLSLFTAVAFALLLVALTRIVPEFEKVFSQVRIPLPTLTIVLLRLSAEVHDFFWVLLVAVALFATELGHWTGRKAAMARVLIPLFSLLIGGWMLLALFLPLIGTLDHGIGARKH